MQHDQHHADQHGYHQGNVQHAEKRRLPHPATSAPRHNDDDAPPPTARHHHTTT
ncbi:hypothetical protein DXG01_004811 [Tephrocybe rancida]|nr:hypothetical protein DXG01_004811 [Tephrocybe rancida]